MRLYRRPSLVRTAYSAATHFAGVRRVNLQLFFYTRYVFVQTPSLVCTAYSATTHLAGVRRVNL